MFKRIISFILIIIIAMASCSLSVHADELKVSAKSAILMNADTGDIIYAKNENEKLPMASTTKIMTALITLEYAAHDNKVVTITDQMVRVEGSSMGLKVGYKLTLKDLAVGMLMVSGNDAANSAAIAIAGSTDKFAELMNKRAQELQLTNTHFETPSGLDSAEHYSTALDMAKLGAAAMENSDFTSIVSQKQLSVSLIEPQQKLRLPNHNRLLSMYNGCIGIKTGFTKKSGRCLVSAAERNGIRLIAVTLNAPDDWDDHQRMFDYGFSCLMTYTIDDSNKQFTVPVVGSETQSITVKGCKAKDLVVRTEDAAKIQCIVELPRFVYAPIKSNQQLGVIRYQLNGKTLASVPLTAVSDTQAYSPHKNIFQKIAEAIKGLFGLKS